MKLIVGLGNPGEEYALTRHNIGRRLMEFIAAEEHQAFKVQKKWKTSLASVSWAGEAIHLAFPQTYMNLSGEAVALLVAHFKLKVSQDLLVVVDDVALPFGKLRLRGQGSCGGHNGLLSIEEKIGADYPRLRIGIGAAGESKDGEGALFQEPLKDYVLSVFDAREEKRMGSLLDAGMKACSIWVQKPLSEAMNQVNSTEL